MAPLKGEADGESKISEKLVAAHDQIVSLKTELETKVLEETKGAKSVKETKVMAQLEKGAKTSKNGQKLKNMGKNGKKS